MASIDLRAVKSGMLSPEKALGINSDVIALSRFAAGIPKAELHLHIEGTFEPELMLKIAKRNGIAPKGYKGNDNTWCKTEKAKRNFKDLQEFLDLYYSGCDILKTEEDFYDLAMDYFMKASDSNVRRAEIFFDPQTHTHERNNLDIEVVINGLNRACVDAKTLTPPVDAALILCFLRHRHEGCEWADPPAEKDEALKVMEEVIEKDLAKYIIAVGLDSSEAGNPPGIFKDAFAKAREVGLKCCAHAGEEGPASYITEALDVLEVDRIDHGVRCVEDENVLKRLRENQIPLTVCPCSNYRLQVFSRFFSGENCVRQLLNHGLKVTINGDDPAYFFGHQDKFGEVHGGYIESNYVSTAKECALSADEIVNIAVNSFESSFISKEDIISYKQLIQDYCDSFDP